MNIYIYIYVCECVRSLHECMNVYVPTHVFIQAKMHARARGTLADQVASARATWEVYNTDVSLNCPVSGLQCPVDTVHSLLYPSLAL